MISSQTRCLHPCLVVKEDDCLINKIDINCDDFVLRQLLNNTLFSESWHKHIYLDVQVAHNYANTLRISGSFR